MGYVDDGRIPRVSWLAVVGRDSQDSANCLRRVVLDRHCTPEALHVLYPPGGEGAAERLEREAREVMLFAVGRDRAGSLDVCSASYEPTDPASLCELLVRIAETESREGFPVVLDLSSCRSRVEATMACIATMAFPGLVRSVYLAGCRTRAGSTAEGEPEDLMEHVADCRCVDEVEREEAWLEDFPW